MVKTHVIRLQGVEERNVRDQIALGTFLSLRMLATYMRRMRNYNLAPVPGKPISANRGLNIANRRINFIPLLDSVPESTINLNLGIN